MKSTTKMAFCLSTLLGLSVGLASAMAQAQEAERFVLANDALSRTLAVEGGILRTVEFLNKVTGAALKPQRAEEFRLRISKGTQFETGDVWLTTEDFVCVAKNEYPLERREGSGLAFVLENNAHHLRVVVRYELEKSDFFMRKRVELEGKPETVVEFIEVESIPAPKGVQPYQKRAITSRADANWRPGLGQPIYDEESVSFWGVEFPASENFVTEGVLRCGFAWGNALEEGKPFLSHWCVAGVGDDFKYILDSFENYIDTIRIRPLRLQVQYNSWFDYGGSISHTNFSQSVSKIHEELVTKRGCPPLNAYAIDAGWMRVSNVTEAAYPVNEKFDPDFASTFETVRDAKSTLGLWLSPGCFFNSRPMVQEYRDAGFEALSLSMSMCGPKYMGLLEKRLLELTTQGVAYFKLDGLFGHLNVRDFELHGRGCPAMPQLSVEKFSANDPKLNDSKYDELKIYYLSAGTERLIQILQKMHEKNPEVYIAITNGAWLSPWWLQHVDVVWLINAGDASSGSTRTEELIYRDGIYYSICQQEYAQFPINSFFNHEPKKTTAGEDPETFRDYLFMHLSRGAGFVELYVRPRSLSEADWDVLAEGLLWAHEFSPAFRRVRMHGGAPDEKAVYGYSGWDGESRGYVSVHNPSDEPQEYVLTLDRGVGMPSNDATWRATMRIGKKSGETSETYRFNDKMSFSLAPREIRLIEFVRE
ncbi:MAG: hypothetical protein Q4D38_07575 [Planctomycetia bacterium]|nr:hypothetical protein [Planctomycetia bacterium]